MTLGEDIMSRTVRQPEAAALWWRGKSVSYGELASRTRGALQELAVHADSTPVAVSAVKTPATIALVLACVIARRPVLLSAPGLGSRAFGQLIAKSGCRWTATAGADTQWRRTRVDRAVQLHDDVLFLLTTSGSTGVPKVVPLEAPAIETFTDWAITMFGLGPGVNVLNDAPLNFDLCLLDIWATLQSGGCVILAERDRAVNPRYLAGLLHGCCPQIVQGVPMFFRIIADAVNGTVFPSVRHLILTGDHAPRPLRAALPDLFPCAQLHNVYGCTETNDSFIYTFSAAEAAAVDVLPLGRPLPGVDARVVADGREVSQPGSGELWVSTPFQTSGYLPADHARFVRRVGRRPFFRTGDVVSRDRDGALTLIGRTDFQVKVRGIRVSLEGIERVIADHDEVAEVAVVALSDPVSGKRLHAVVKPRSDRLTSLKLRQHCAQCLDRAAIPSVISIVGEPLPTTSTGKVDRNRIAEELREADEHF
jgi:acyl-coenzyme A synthetase/AMP-(fatty) acid ligase